VIVVLELWALGFALFVPFDIAGAISAVLGILAEFLDLGCFGISAVLEIGPKSTQAGSTP
jgi:hypothetical protein